ncbi:hypothetical protein [Acidisphaera rubrifaciens]|uniref:Uncharacterized protein n=1 Tax=Acidisphaera rubrifaciens HS-AP3 TaxID=1231350 RepID=A0A0D6P4S0_9PROT|nr:hypothetical protein [Acidisphaera rubrifaciens]GAN76647.1 hypothetical protein Asru_0137_08 [Acidisphaera rubrifaciens HS-AP3]
MQMTVRDALTVLHGMCFGALFLLAFSGALVGLYRMAAGATVALPRRDQRLFAAYLVVMVVLGWAAVLSGAYVIYPWYRAIAPAGADLHDFPQRLLLSSPATSGWHDLGMEWKEHVAWIAPITMTMAAYVFVRYRAWSVRFRGLYAAVFAFAVVAFLAAGTAGGFGAFLNKFAPVRGGAVLTLMQGGG